MRRWVPRDGGAVVELYEYDEGKRRHVIGRCWRSFSHFSSNTWRWRAVVGADLVAHSITGDDARRVVEAHIGKRCHLPASRCPAVWTCRGCGAMCCEHRCGNKSISADVVAMATCSGCARKPRARP